MYYIENHATDTWVYEQCALRGIPLNQWSDEMAAIYPEWHDLPAVTRNTYIETAKVEYDRAAHERSMRRLYGRGYKSA